MGRSIGLFLGQNGAALAGHRFRLALAIKLTGRALTERVRRALDDRAMRATAVAMARTLASGECAGRAAGLPVRS